MPNVNAAVARGPLEAAPIVYPPFSRRIPEGETLSGSYRIRFARTGADLDAVLRLRFEVFNLELGEGLAASFETGRDEDEFDRTCHHLMVEDRATGRLAGTYRMQTSEMAAARGGFYSAGEFDLSTIPAAVLDRSVEVGRACIAREYRNRSVLFLLWRGIAAYMIHNRKRYLFGCCSLATQDPAVARQIEDYFAAADALHPRVRVKPVPSAACPAPAPGPAPGDEPAIPILFRTYLRYGARVCGPPAIDREFGTVDFFVILDVEEIEPDLRRLYFNPAPPARGASGRGSAA